MRSLRPLQPDWAAPPSHSRRQATPSSIVPVSCIQAIVMLLICELLPYVEDGRTPHMMSPWRRIKRGGGEEVREGGSEDEEGLLA